MKRNLNENAELNYDDSIKICVSKIREDDSELDCNRLRDIFVENGATVEGEHGQYEGKPATFMIVSNLLEYDVVDILNDFLGESEYTETAESYIISDDVDTTYTIEPEDPEFPAYEDIELDPEKDALNDEALLEGDNILDDAKDELRGVLSKVEDEIYLSDEGIVLDTVLSNDNLVVYSIRANGDMDTDEEKVVNAFDLTDADDIFTLCDVINDALDSEYPAYDDVEDDEEYTPRVEKMRPHRRLIEKKKDDCCPGTKSVNEAKAIDIVLNDIDQQILNEAEEVNRKKEQKLNIKVLNAINERKHSLYPNISYNGKSFDKMTIKELKRIYENVSTTVKKLKAKSLNESVVDQKTLDTIDKKNQLLEYIDNEITYRTTLVECMKKLNEDGAEISDEELKNLFGPAQGEEATPENTEDSNSDENKSKENSDKNKEDNNSAEEGEVVEISRVVITLKDAEAANDLKQACIEAEIPEDAFELENVDEESATEDENSDENKSDENSEDNNNSEETSDENSEDNNSQENANESYEYAKYVQMLAEGEFGFDQSSEEDGNEENGEEQSTENTEENSDENSDENDENKEDDKQPKFILTNTDYISTLAKVLDNVYGISKEEFEDMIGGPIVEDEDNDENSDENKGDENKKESSDENSDENNEEEIDPSDLFKNL